MTTLASLVLLFSPWILWACYVLVMGLYRAHLDRRLTPFTYVLGAPWLALGLAVDVVVNVSFASLVFLEPPFELLVTQRLQRHSQATTGWRHRLAVWICTRVLDPFDPTGNHCD